MTDDTTVSEGEVVTPQEPVSEAAAAVQEQASEGADAQQQEQAAPDAEAEAKAEADAKAEREAQSQRDKDAEKQRLINENRALQRRIQEREQSERERAAEARRAELNRLRDSDDPEERDRYLEIVRRQEEAAEVAGTASQRARAEAANNIFAEVVRGEHIGGLTEQEYMEAIEAVGQKLDADPNAPVNPQTGRAIVPPARAIDALIARVVEKQTQEVPKLREEIATLKADLEAAQNQLAGANINGGKGPPKGGAGAAINGRSDEEIIRDPRTPIEEVQAARDRIRAR